MTPPNWRDAVKAAAPLARSQWRAEGLPGPHVVLLGCALETPTLWVLVHGHADEFKPDAADDPGAVIMDPPAVVIDRATGVPSVVSYVGLDLSEAVPVGDYPPHLLDDAADA